METESQSRESGGRSPRAAPPRGRDAAKEKDRESDSSEHSGQENGGGGEQPHDREGDNQPDKQKQPKGKPWYRRPAPVGILVLVVIAATVGGALWWRHSRRYTSTD